MLERNKEGDGSCTSEGLLSACMMSFGLAELILDAGCSVDKVDPLSGVSREDFNFLRCGITWFSFTSGANSKG